MVFILPALVVGGSGVHMDGFRLVAMLYISKALGVDGYSVYIEGFRRWWRQCL